MQYSQTTTLSLCLSSLVTINEIIGNGEDYSTNFLTALSLVDPILDLTILAKNLYENSVSEKEAAFQAGMILGSHTSVSLDTLSSVWENIRDSVRVAFEIVADKEVVTTSSIGTQYHDNSTPIDTFHSQERFERFLPVFNMFKEMRNFDQAYVSPRAMLTLLIHIAFHYEPN